jgi:hypothetical protein
MIMSILRFFNPAYCQTKRKRASSPHGSVRVNEIFIKDLKLGEANPSRFEPLDGTSTNVPSLDGSGRRTGSSTSNLSCRQEREESVRKGLMILNQMGQTTNDAMRRYRGERLLQDVDTLEPLPLSNVHSSLYDDDCSS